MNIIGIIICGKKEYEVPKDIWEEEIKKIVDRAKEKDKEWKLNFIYEKSLESTPLLSRVKELISLSETTGSDFYERIQLTPVVTDWLRYKENAGWKRDNKMVEMGNYCLCFLPNSSDLSTSPARFLLPKARKERLIVREIFPLEEKKELKPILPGSLTLNL